MKLLIIEQNLKLQMALTSSLKKAGYQTNAVRDGEEGLYEAMNFPYDGVILGSSSSRVNGLELLKRIHQSNSRIFVMMVTNRDSVHDKIQALDSGADDYLVLPLSLPELLARLRAVIRRTHQLTDDQLVLDDIKIDIEGKTVTKKDTPVKLTAREFIILEALALQKKRTVSCSSIQDRLHQKGEEVSQNCFIVHIYNLRKKLGKERIINHRGLGYQLL